MVFRGLRSWWERRSEGYDLQDPFVRYLLGGAGPTVSGVDVTPETALRCSPVFACVRTIAESVQLLPVHMYKRTADGGKERATDHPVSALLTSAANDWTPAAEFRLLMTTQLALHGRAYAYVGRDDAGRPVEMIPLDSRAVMVTLHAVTMEPTYSVTVGGVTTEYDRRSILHLRSIGAKMEDGESPVTLGREAIGLALVLEQHAAGMFGRGARPSGILKHPEKLKDDGVAARLREGFERLYKGGANAGRTVILENGMSFEQLQLSSVDAQFLESRRFQVQEVSRFWRVPLHLLNDLERTTHNNAEHMGQQFLTFCLLPILRMWQDALAITLLTTEERREYFIEFMVDEVAKADLGTRFEALGKAVGAPWLTRDEARALDNRPPLPGGEGRTLVTPLNMSTGGGNDDAAR